MIDPPVHFLHEQVSEEQWGPRFFTACGLHLAPWTGLDLVVMPDGGKVRITTLPGGTITCGPCKRVMARPGYTPVRLG